MKLKIFLLAPCTLLLILLPACGVTKPVATTHTERIEEKVMPVAVGADTIEIVLNVGTRHAVSANPNGNSRDARLERPMTREGQNPTSTASSNLCKSDERLLTKSNSEFCNKREQKPNLFGLCRVRTKSRAKRVIEKELKNQSDLCNLWETPHPEGVNSVSSVGSVREKENSVRIKSTRGVNISRYETDTTSTLRITLRPDTVFVPYTNHIRSDTIVVPDRICQQKLNRSNMTNLFLILILIAIIIIFLKNRMTR